MKVYFTLTDGVENSEINLDMLRLALKSAQENTSLKLYALYEGTKEDSAYKIFIENGVNVTLCTCSFKDKLERYYGDLQTNNLRASIKRMLGCFMKFDISLYEKDDDVILYSDIDTMFLKDADWDSFKVQRLAVAPEFNKDYDLIKGYRYFSAGIMLINLPELRKRREKLFDMLDNKIPPYQECWDQGFWNELYKDDFEEWGAEFNWKPYWGINDNANIIHIHGFKLGSLTPADFVFCGELQNRFSNAYEGWMYYSMKAYRILDFDKDKYHAALAVFLMNAKKEHGLEKQWYLSTYLLHFIYVKFKKFENVRIVGKLYKYTRKKLIKRDIIPAE
jgi:hypothetical protein